MKKPWTEHVGDFIMGKGFYIVLFLCVAAIGISGYYLFSSLGGGGQDTAVNGPAQIVVTPAPNTPAPSITPVRPTAAPTPSPSSAPASTPAPAPTAAPSPSPSPAPTPAAFVWPVRGEVASDFSLETLAYDETMGDWRTHSGIDITAALGTEVMAVCAGTVTQVYQDDLMGTTVVVDHGGGLESFYCNLASVPVVSEGDQVSAGDILGAVGSTALAESRRATHLHLEMAKDGLAVDPVLYLPEQ